MRVTTEKKNGEVKQSQRTADKQLKLTQGLEKLPTSTGTRLIFPHVTRGGNSRHSDSTNCRVALFVPLDAFSWQDGFDLANEDAATQFRMKLPAQPTVDTPRWKSFRRQTRFSHSGSGEERGSSRFFQACLRLQGRIARVVVWEPIVWQTVEDGLRAKGSPSTNLSQRSCKPYHRTRF